MRSHHLMQLSCDAPPYMALWRRRKRATQWARDIDYRVQVQTFD